MDRALLVMLEGSGRLGACVHRIKTAPDHIYLHMASPDGRGGVRVWMCADCTATRCYYGRGHRCPTLRQVMSAGTGLKFLQ